MAHNYSLRSRGLVPTLATDSLIDLSTNSRQNVNTEQSQTNEENSNPSSLNELGHGMSPGGASLTLGQMRNELEQLRAQKNSHEKLIKRLTQELNVKDDQIHQMSENHGQSIEKLSSQMTQLMNDHQSNAYQSSHRAIPKLPNFSGSSDEKIEVWITQFDEALHFLNDAEKLQELLPKFRDTAADFVFGQLTPEIRRDYHLLASELITRFKKIETRKMYKVQYEKRKQKIGENVQNFAADLKQLYDKAYPGRPRNIRNEDLVEKFMDGLLDDKAKFQVEYHRNPATIDQAVYEVIHYLEVFGQSEKKTSYSATTQSN